MNLKIFAVVALFAIAPSTGFAQSCSKGGGAGSCNGNQGLRPVGGGNAPFGGFPPLGGPPGSTPYNAPSYGGSVYGNSFDGNRPSGVSNLGAQQLRQCTSCGQQFRGSHVCAVKPASNPLPAPAPVAVKESTPAPVVESEPTAVRLDELFSVTSDPGRFNVEVKNPIGTDFRIVKSDLNMKQATALGDQLREAFWIVTKGAGANPTAKIAGDSAEAQKLARTISENDKVRPSIESIAYRIVPVEEPETDLWGVAEDAIKNPEPSSASDLPLVAQSEPESTSAPDLPAEEWSGVTVGSDGEPKKFTLRLDADGLAEISVPTSDGDADTIRSRYSIDDDQLVLTGGSGQKTIIGQIVSKDDQRMTLKRPTGQLTMFRQ